MKVDNLVKMQRDRQQNNQREPRPVKVKRIEPTPEQAARSDFKSAGMAYKKTPVIETMLKRGQITTAEYISLSYYRDQATAADRSPIKSNIDFAVRSGNARPIGYSTPQEIETARIEHDLGQLQAIARAIAVDDQSVSEWCIAKHGGRERMQGRAIVLVPRTEKHTRLAVQDLKMAAHRIVI